jgi:excisionase family DNA binding protein
MIPKDEILTKEQTCHYLNIGKGTLQKLMQKQGLPYIKLERKVLFRLSDIDKWLEIYKVGPDTSRARRSK